MADDFLKDLHPPGLNKKLQSWADKNLSSKDIFNLNDQLLKEAKKFPHLSVSGVVTGPGQINFFYEPRTPRTMADKIDDLIESERKKLKK